MPATWDNAVTPPGAEFGAPYGYASAYEHHTSYTQHYMFNVQRQFGPNWVIEGATWVRKVITSTASKRPITACPRR